MTRVLWVSRCLALVFAASVVLAAQAQAPPTPLTFEAALNLAAGRNLRVDAARRQRAVRESAVRTAGLVPNPEIVAESSRDTPHQLVSVDVPIEIGGKRSRRLDLAREELSLAEGDVQVELRSVRREVREAFYSLIAANERVRLAENAVEIAQRLRDIAQARFDAGAVPRLEVLQADLGVARASTDLDLVRSIQTSVRANLNGVLNLPPDERTDVTGALADHTASAPSYDEAKRIALASNIDLLNLDRQAAIERRRTDLLRAERVPTPVFAFGALFNAPGEFNTGGRFAVAMSVPLFNRNQGEIAGSLAATSQLQAQREARQRTIENALFGTVARIRAQRQRADAYTSRLVPTAVDLESLAEESYRAGRTSVLSVLDAQRTVRDVRDEALQAALDVQTSIAELEELLGTAVQ
jgi:cobalt-zinc-cadmium efflux system outer membrane protein